MNPFFMHYRHLLPKDGKMVLDNRGGVTIAYELEDAPGGHTTVWYAFAECNELDNFCRKIGRDKAAGRLRSDRYRMLLVMDKAAPRYHEIREALREAYIEYKVLYNPEITNYLGG